MVALLHSATPAWDICPIIEDKWYHNLRCLDRIAHRNEVLARKLCLLCLPCQHRFCHYSGFEAYIRIRT